MWPLAAATAVLALGGGQSTTGASGGGTSGGAGALGNIFGGHSDGDGNSGSSLESTACACAQAVASGYTQNIFAPSGYVEHVCLGDYYGLPMGDAHKLVAGYPDYTLNSHYVVTPRNTFACDISLADADEVLNSYAQVSSYLGECGDIKIWDPTPLELKKFPQDDNHMKCNDTTHTIILYHRMQFYDII